MKHLLSFATLAIVAIAFSAFTTAGAGGPDLAIGDVKVQCGAAGQRFLVIMIQNNGDTKNTATNIRIRPTDGDDTTQKCIQAAVKNVPQIQPGKEFRLRVPLKNAPCDCKNTMKFDLFVDHTNVIAESDETNNEKHFEVAGEKNN